MLVGVRFVLPPWGFGAATAGWAFAFLHLLFGAICELLSWGTGDEYRYYSSSKARENLSSIGFVIEITAR